MAEEIKRHKAIGELRFYDGLELIGQKEIDVKNGGGRYGWEERIRLMGMEVVEDGMVATEWCV